MTDASLQHPPIAYWWCGKDQYGRWRSGRLMATNAADVQHQLRPQRVRVCFHMRAWHQRWQTTRLRQSRISYSNIAYSDITRLTRQLATLLHAGLPLLQSLRLMTQDTETSPCGALLASLCQAIESGQSLSAAMRATSAFDDPYCNLVAVGESSGQLEHLLQRLAHDREKSQALNKRLRSALTYPCLVLGIGVTVGVMLLTWVVPAFEQVFQNLGAALPPLTQSVLAISRALIAHGPEWAVGVLGLGVALRHAIQRTEAGQRIWDATRLRAPLWGRLTRHAQCARWCRTLSTLMQAGIAIHEALDQLAQVANHRDYRAATLAIRSQLALGHRLSDGLRAYPLLFAPFLIQMCVVGEESGTLDDMLARMAEHHEQAVDEFTQHLATLMEPAIMLVLGLTIGTLVLAMYWPIFQIGQVL